MIVTCADVPKLDPDDRLLITELESRGIIAAISVWDDPHVDWSSVPLCVLRSTWDYHRRCGAFLSWIDHVAAVTSVCNHPQLLRWNADKSYLFELGSLGVPVLPTVRVTGDCPEELSAIISTQGWSEVVIKPTKGAAAHDVLLVPNGEVHAKRGQEHLDRLTRVGDALVQPFLRSVITYGERALVFFNGSYSHAVIKKPFNTVLAVHATASSAVTASSEEIAVASNALRCLPRLPLYARVDLIHGDEGQIYVNEVELIEPGLYIGAHPSACSEFATAVERNLEQALVGVLG